MSRGLLAIRDRRPGRWRCHLCPTDWEDNPNPAKALRLHYDATHSDESEEENPA